MLLLFVYLFLALLISFICSVTEAVLLTANHSFLTLKKETGLAWAAGFEKLKENINKPLSAILSLNTVSHTIGAAGVGAQANIIWGNAYFAIVSAILTCLILIFSEIIPKTIGTIYYKSWSKFTYYTIKSMIFITYPLIFVAMGISRIFTTSQKEQRTSREEISILTHIGANEGIFSENENKMIQNILKLKNIRVSKVMTPRKIVAMADEEMSCREFMDSPEFKQFSRILLYTGSDEHITGYVLRQLVLTHLAEDLDTVPLKKIKHEIIVAPNTSPLFSVWEHLMYHKEHICLIVDEYGVMEGIVTQEDIIESIIGLEIVDETDTIPDLQQFARDQWMQKTNTHS